MNQKRYVQGMTLIELLVVIVAVVVLASMLLPGFSGRRKVSQLMVCKLSLKQIGFAYRTWAGDHSNAYPWAVGEALGGLQETLTNADQGSNCWKVYKEIARNFGNSPKVVRCPADERQAGTNFNGHFGNVNVSYFVGVGGNENHSELILGGDRNLAPGLVAKDDYGFSPGNGQGNDVFLQTNTPVCWSRKMHTVRNPAGVGNVLLADCSVRSVSNSRLRSNCLASAIIGPGTNAGSTFRLVFP